MFIMSKKDHVCLQHRGKPWMNVSYKKKQSRYNAWIMEYVSGAYDADMKNLQKLAKKMFM
jgi:hypothetical protein